MKKCRDCEIEYPLTEYGLYPSGTLKPYCKSCYRAAQRKRRRLMREGLAKAVPDYAPNCTEMRHPDPSFMERNVKRMVKVYAARQKKIGKAGLGMGSGTGLCDAALAQ